MDADMLSRHFARMGARVALRDHAPGRISLNVQRDRDGEFFDLAVGRGYDLDVVDVRPGDRHLLVLARHAASAEKEKFLCGHDERAWFVAAVPGARGVSNVRTAMQALKPADVRRLEDRLGVRAKDRARRRTAAFVRQGEWFFVPEPDMTVPPGMINHGEVLRRGAGKPHIADFGFRTGGETVYVSPLAPNGLTRDAYEKRISQSPKARRATWTIMRRNAGVYVKGRVRHADHATILLPCWHRVLMNTENQAPAMRHVAFLD